MGEATSNKAITVGLYYCILSLSFPLNIIYLFSLYKGFQVGISHLCVGGVGDNKKSWSWNSVMPYFISTTLGKSNISYLKFSVFH